MTELEWPEGQTHLDFIRQLSSEELTLETHANLSLDVTFITRFLELSSVHAQELAAAMESAPLPVINLMGVPKIAGHKATLTCWAA